MYDIAGVIDVIIMKFDGVEHADSCVGSPALFLTVLCLSA